MIEILVVLEDKDNFNRYRDLVLHYNDDPDIRRVIDNIAKYYEETKADTLDWTTFDTFFFLKNPMLKDERKMLFEGLFKKLLGVDRTLKESFVETFLERYYAQRIAFEASEVAEGKPGKRITTLSDELQDYLSLTKRLTTGKNEICTKTLTELLEGTSPGTGLRWRLSCLNDSLGELHTGKLLLFGGRPDSGKTTMLTSEGTHMAAQLPEEKRLYYFGNEEDDDALMPRIICSALGVDRSKLESDPDFYWDEYIRLMGGDPLKIKLCDKSSTSVHDIERMIGQGDCGLIIIDQLRKVQGFDKIEGIKRTEKLFNWAREICKEYAPVITVGQLDVAAENEAYPHMGMLYESKTAAQGELDAMITIGRVRGSVPANARYISFPKNKMPRPDVPSMRHGQYEVQLMADIGRFI